MCLFRRPVLVAILLGFLDPLSAHEADGPEVRLEIPSQPVESALREFASKTGLQLLFVAGDTSLRQSSREVRGLHTPREVLDCLLADSDLEYRYVNTRTVAISERRVHFRDGYVVFKDAAVAEVVAELNRYGSRKVYVEDPSLATVVVSGNLRCDNVDALIFLLHDLFPLRIERDGNRIVLGRQRQSK
jgi:transmembrane sensor